MKIIGFSSGGVGREGNADRMVKAIMEKSGFETEFVKLADFTYSGCKGCVDLCAEPQVCRLDDGLGPYYQKVKDADAVVVGSSVYFGGINAMARSFLERFFGYRHVSIAIKDKPFVLAVSGGGNLETVTESFRNALQPFMVNILDVVQYTSGIPPCFSCGRHKECRIGGLYMARGEASHKLDIKPEFFHKWENDPRTVTWIETAAEKLRKL